MLIVKYPSIIKFIDKHKRVIKKVSTRNVCDDELNGIYEKIYIYHKKYVRSAYRLETYVNIQRFLEKKVGTTFFDDNIVKFLLKDNKIIMLGAINKKYKCWQTILVDPVLTNESDTKKFFALFNAKVMMNNGFILKRKIDFNTDMPSIFKRIKAYE